MLLRGFCMLLHSSYLLLHWSHLQLCELAPHFT